MATTHKRIGNKFVLVYLDGSRTDRTYTLCSSYGHPRFRPTSTHLVLGGIPLKLESFDGISVTEVNGTTLRKRVYALSVIEIETITSSSEFSAVIDGTRLSLSQDSNKYLYLDIITGSLDQIPDDEIIINGIPMAIDVNDRLIVLNSGYSSTDIEEYGSVMWGGMPLRIGRVQNDWYLIANPQIINPS